MSAAQSLTVAEQYDRALRYGRDSRVPAHAPAPRPTSEWPPENVTLLERYRAWLESGGLSANVINQLYLPTAGHVLGLNLKPHAQLDLETDLARALDYIKAKRLSAEWTDNSRIALAKFRCFLLQERGQWVSPRRPLGLARYRVGLPAWVLIPLERYYHLRQSQWRPARRNTQSLSFWRSYTLVWQWLFAHYPIQTITDLKRQYLRDYLDQMLQQGYAASTINNALRCFHALILFLQELDQPVPPTLLRPPPSLTEPDRLPRFLTDAQVRRLRNHLEQRVAQARFAAERRDALLDRAAFYLLWQGGMRLGEVEELHLEDLDLPARKLSVRNGKGQKDRTICLTDTTVGAILAYLNVRGQGPPDHVFLYRHHPVCKDLIRCRIKDAGKRVGVKVTPHNLRHTMATQLLNAGCRVTTIQKLLGHHDLRSTMIYARVHDRTVAGDYYTAMAQIEKALNLTVGVEADELPSVDPQERKQLLELSTQLAASRLGRERRLNLVAKMQCMLNGKMQNPLTP